MRKIDAFIVTMLTIMLIVLWCIIEKVHVIQFDVEQIKLNDTVEKHETADELRSRYDAQVELEQQKAPTPTVHWQRQFDRR